MARGANRRLLFVAFVAALALPALGQRRTFQTGPAVAESTLTVFPQINETWSTKPMKPANPTFATPSGPGNNLLVNGGIMQGVQRVTPGIKFPGIGATGWEPPDPTLAAGPNHIVSTVNSSVAFFSKTGSRTFQQDLGPSGFFASVNPTNFVFDPKVFFDHIAQRFVIVCPELDQGGVQSKCLVAVSDDADPNGVWFKYRVEAKVTQGSNNFWLDYPGWGYNKDAYVITGNMFNFGSGPFGGVQFIVLPKAPMLTGGTVNVTSIMNATSFTVQMCHTMDVNLDRIYGISEQTDTQLRVFCVQNLTATPTLAVGGVAVPRFNSNSVAQSKNGANLDTVGSRLIASYYRAGKIVAAHTVGTTANDNRAAVRWYEVDTQSWPASGTVTLRQSGQINPPPGEHYWMPGISSNKNGDIALCFSRCSSTIAADMMIAGRKSSDPLGSMGQPRSVFTSAGAYSPGGHRWGDYAEVCTDPADDTTFWGVVMTIASSGNWATEIQKWTVTSGGGGGGGNVINPIAASTYQGQYVRGTVQDLASNNDAFYQVATTPVVRLGNVAAIQADYVVPAGTSSIQVSFRALTDIAASATGMLWLYNWGTGNWDHKKSFTLPSSGTASQSFSLNSGLSAYVNSSRQVRIVVRGLTPTSTLSAKPFVLKLDSAQLTTN